MEGVHRPPPVVAAVDDDDSESLSSQAVSEDTVNAFPNKGYGNNSYQPRQYNPATRGKSYVRKGNQGNYGKGATQANRNTRPPGRNNGPRSGNSSGPRRVTYVAYEDEKGNTIWEVEPPEDSTPPAAHVQADEAKESEEGVHGISARAGPDSESDTDEWPAVSFLGV